MSKWRDIETAPKDGTVITLRGRHHHDGEREVVREGHYDTGGHTEGWETERGAWFIPTHWLPSPPSTIDRRTE